MRGLVARSAVIVALTAVAGIGLQGAALLGLGASVVGLEAWRIALWSTSGASAVMAVAGAAVLAATTVARQRAFSDAPGPIEPGNRVAPSRWGLGGRLGLALGAAIGSQCTPSLLR